MKLIAEASQIIKPVSVTDGAGVKIKRSIGLNPDYFDPFLCWMSLAQKTKMTILLVSSASSQRNRDCNVYVSRRF